MYEEQEFEMRVLVINWHEAFLPYIAGEADLNNPKQFSWKDFGSVFLSFTDEYAYVPDSAMTILGGNFMAAMLVVSATLAF